MQGFIIIQKETTTTWSKWFNFQQLPAICNWNFWLQFLHVKSSAHLQVKWTVTKGFLVLSFFTLFASVQYHHISAPCVNRMKQTDYRLHKRTWYHSEIIWEQRTCSAAQAPSGFQICERSMWFKRAWTRVVARGTKLSTSRCTRRKARATTWTFTRTVTGCLSKTTLLRKPRQMSRRKSRLWQPSETG